MSPPRPIADNQSERLRASQDSQPCSRADCVMEALDPDRILSFVDTFPPPPGEVRDFLAGGDVQPSQLIRALRSAFSPDGPTIGDTPWWDHAIAVAEGAAMVAESTESADPRMAYVAGFLHDVGHLVMVRLDPQAFHQVLARQGDGTPFMAIERELCGLDHVRIGEHFARRWGLPDEICAVVRGHHELEGEITPLFASVVLADVWAQVLGYGYDFPAGGISFRVDEAALAADLIWSEQIDLLAQADYRVVARRRELGATPRPFASKDGGAERALWVSVHGGEPTPLGRMLLQHRGYEVVHVAATERLEAQGASLILIDSPWAEPDEVGDLVTALVPDGHAHVALLAEVGPEQTSRRRDPLSGICGIPRMFTAFDLRWLQSCPAVVG